MIRLGVGAVDLERAAGWLREGRLVALPTETVYGLGADASNPDAVRRIFAAKGRPPDHPVIVHLPDAAALDGWAGEVPEAARRLAAAFWPGPLTLVLKRGPQVDDVITGGQQTVGLRVPAHPVAAALLQRFGGALAAPSANRFGHVSPTTADHVLDEFGDEVKAVIDGGPCTVGLESTIVDLSGERPRLLRPGMIPLADLETVLGHPLDQAGEGEGPKASGRLPSHYAPRASLAVVAVDALAGAIARAMETGSVAVLSRRPAPERDVRVAWQQLPDAPADYARELYAAMRRADAAGPACILVEAVPDGPDWQAIRDRLARAAA
ncbi:threonylcarbamoyl-AMP synthase [Wenzhouxiangella sp. XN79A]|uniref:L-threonylcarbamoyladenylate synthase n=1 Tax=Wenzhouxiangella sp. XN79A TaxID=2724193 RepID=UPI00144AD920|nr:L-threonylcarbamoyladenylate synthase [Wenzhouxiangella sp. XN79A]NKI34804.1 threonylcarbamoyl-AMP synthase [Wenzhouxiangella sp. XN79A]